MMPVPTPSARSTRRAKTPFELMTDQVDSDSELQPLAKRRRKLSTSLEVDPENSRFWFQDGDIVLDVEDTRLKVHRAHLKASLIFSTMLELPQPESTELFDGCPLVKLPHDTLHDWIAVLEWMYDRRSFELRSVLLDVVAGALRIATKYEILELHQWCKQQLFLRWPLNLVEMNTTAMPNSAEAICLAREFDIPEILPAAFYALAVQRWENGRDGWRSHLILSPDDLRRLIVGREVLQERLTALLVNWDPRRNGELYRVCSVCRPICMHWLSTQLMPASHSPYISWLLSDLDRLSKDGLRGLSDCHSHCANVLRYTLGKFLIQLQDAIPKYFML